MFRPQNLPLLAGVQARHLLSRKNKVREVFISLDLGLTETRCKLTVDGLIVGKRLVDWMSLEKIANMPEDVFIVGEKVERLQWFENSFYRMVLPRWGHAPTLEINGIRMHRTVDITPEEDARQKVGIVSRLKKANVLDVCTGLGYTVSAALRRGAAGIVTVEKDLNVLKMASYNPWSTPLFDRRVTIVLEDAVDFLHNCDQVFDTIVHDPPTIKMAGELYSLDFYRQLYRVLKKGGELVHYVGQPGLRRGMRIYAGVMERLRKAGFKARYVPWTRCVKAVKV